MNTQSDRDIPLSARLDFACSLARQVGREALLYWNEQGVEGLGTEAKGLQDFVTKADKAAERTIRKELKQMFPEDGFIGEETGGSSSTTGTWVVDPIDGTANYMRGLRHWGVSIAYVSDGQTKLGIVHDSPTDRLYHAQAGHGAYCDGQAISVSTTKDPQASMGILGASRRTPLNDYLGRIKSLHNAGIEHRKIGSAAIGIIRVAEGVVDFYHEGHLNSWDALAALLIAEEAGGMVNVPKIDKFVAQGGEVLCATPALSKQLADLLVSKSVVSS
ncbi:MAG: inositol monophosphatase [Blastopirellula sp.]|nr:MAG: inositol monophosphatase [Blastopirellula sp.]